jgi:hypothetical protein
MVMKEPRKYQVHAKRYQTLARGYAALNSKLAETANGAARAYERLADETDRRSNAEPPKQSAYMASPN